MAEYDGSVRIKTEIDSKNASAQLMSLENRIVKTADKVASLRSKMDSLKNAQIPTEAYTEVQNQITETEKKLTALYERQEKFLETGGKTRTSAYQKMQYDIEQLENTLTYAKSELQDLVDTGKAFTIGSGTQEYANLAQQLGYAEGELAVLNQRHDELIAKQNSTANGYRKIGKVAKTSLEKVSKAADKSSKSLSGISMGFKNILKYGLGIRSLYILFNKIRAAITEGFENLYNSSERFKNSVDGLKASATTLKNSFAAAFAPIVEIAIPYIQKLIDYISQLLGMVAQFTAAITGQKTYTKAIKQTAVAIKDETKAAEGYLSPLDEINKYKSTDSEDENAGAMFEEVPIDSSMLNFVDKLKEQLQPILKYAQKLKDIFSQGFFSGLGDWEYRWESIKESAASIKDSLIDIWTDQNVLNAADKWAQSVAYTLGRLSGSVASIGLTIATNLVGGISIYLDQNKDRIKSYLISMFDIGSDINNLFSDLFASISYVFEAFASENGQQLTTNIIGIFVDAFMYITELASKLFRDIANIIIQPFVDNKEAFRTALEGFLGVLSEVTGTIKDGIDETFDKLNEVYDEHFKPFFDSIASGLSDTVGKFMEFWNGSVQPILDEWAENFDTLWKEHIQPMLNKFIELFGDAVDFLKAGWENSLKPLIDWIVETILPVILPIIDTVVKVLMVAGGAIADVIGGIIDVIGGIIKFLTGVFTGDWEKAWNGIVKIFNGIWGAIKGIVNGILGVVEALANGVVKGINTVIRALNNLSFDVPSWVTDLTGMTKFGFNIPTLSNVSIPRLATGTVVPPNREFMAVLGDNKKEPEVVSPLSTMRQALREELQSLGIGTGSNQTLVLKLYLDGKQVAEAVVKEGKVQQMSSGKNMFLLGGTP